MTPLVAATIRRTVLDNGLTVIVKPAPATGSVAIHAYVKAGAMFDDGQPGCARFVGSLLMRGTRRRTAHQIAEDLDATGATLAVIPGLEVTAVAGRALAEDLPVLLGIVGEVLAEPAFPPDEVEITRGRLLTDARVNAGDTRYVAERLFRRLAYPPGNPHAQPADGEETVLAALGAGELTAFHFRRYAPEAAALVIAGDVDAGRAADAAAQALGGWNRGGGRELPSVPVPAAFTQRREETVVPGKTQSDLLLGGPGIARTDPDYYPTMLADVVLGQLGMQGRIGENVRERLGMAYYARSELQGGLLAGPWWVRAGVNPANIERAVEAILDEIRALQHEGPAADELADARTFAIGFLAVRLETNQGLAQMLANIELFGLSLDYFERHRAIIEGVGRDAVVAAIRRFPLEDYTLAIAGPKR